jgi:NADH-quinone oxidoreductase subunit N
MPIDWTGLISYLILAAGGTLVFCVGAFWRQRPRELLFALSLTAVVATGAAALLVTPWHATSEGLVDLGGYARYFTLLLMAVTGLSLLFVRPYAAARGFAGDELYAMLLFSALGMVLVAAAVNWVMFFLGLELLSLTLYVLIAMRKGDAAGNEAAVKYFIMGAVASGFLTFGIALLYAMSGTLQVTGSLAAASAYPERVPGIILGLALILAGIGFKISLAPFHLWTPDVYQGAPAPITAFLAAGSKVALFAALLRFSRLLAAPVWSYAIPMLWVLALVTMVAGNLTALYQTRVKRLLAYSSVAQMGYLFMTLLAVKQSGPPAILFYLAVYALMDLGAFGIIGSLSPEAGDLDDLEGYQGLGYTQPWRGGILAVCLISLAGLPPTAGFMGKFVLFRAVVDANYLALAVIGMITVIISIYFYMKVVVALYMRPAAAGAVPPGADPGIGLACSVVGVMIFWLGIFPEPLFRVISRVVAALVQLT